MSEAPFRCSTLMQAPGLTHKLQTRLERLARDKHQLIEKICKLQTIQFYDIDTWMNTGQTDWRAGDSVIKLFSSSKFLKNMGCHDTQQNDTSHNDIQQNSNNYVINVPNKFQPNLKLERQGEKSLNK